MEVRVAEMTIRKPTSPPGMKKHQARILFMEDVIGPENVHKQLLTID